MLSVLTAHLVLEVSVVLQDRTLVGACPHIVLHHVLLLGQVAIKLEQRHTKGTWHVAQQTATAMAALRQREGLTASTSLGRPCTLLQPEPNRQEPAASEVGAGI